MAPKRSIELSYSFTNELKKLKLLEKMLKSFILQTKNIFNHNKKTIFFLQFSILNKSERFILTHLSSQFKVHFHFKEAQRNSQVERVDQGNATKKVALCCLNVMFCYFCLHFRKVKIYFIRDAHRVKPFLKIDWSMNPFSCLCCDQSYSCYAPLPCCR